MKLFFIYPIACMLAGSILLGGCYYDVEEELYPNDTCLTENMSYQLDIAPVIALNCISCHSMANAPVQGGGIMLDTYNRVKNQVDFGRLLGSLRHESGFSFMPQGQPKLPDCTIDKIAAWIEDGAPNN